MDSQIDQTEGGLMELVAHLPDLVLRASNIIEDYPAVQHVECAVMFLDISGFTALCERHNKLNLGVDVLTKTLNDYLGHIENAILKNGGDVIEFAGDALLVVWEADDGTEREVMARAVRCARQIQKKCHDWKTDAGISLAVKIALSFGMIAVTYVGNDSCRHYSSSGPAVMEANNTEKLCSRGSIVLSQHAWEVCPDHSEAVVEELPDGGEVKLVALNKSWADEELRNVRKEAHAHDALKSGKKLKGEPRIRKINPKTVRKSKIRPFIATPVLSKFDEHQSLDYLCEMREVTVVFISLHMDAAHEHSVCLQAIYDKINASVSQFQGMINKIFEFDKGTSFLVLFGLPGFKHEHEACHAVQCAGQIKDVVSAMMEVRQISIGVTTGKVFCGVVGHAERHEYTVIGPKVNMAARLMTHYIGKVTCDEETKRRSRYDSRAFVKVPDMELKGIDNPGVVWEYTGAGNIDNSIPEYGYPLLAYVEEFEICWKALWRILDHHQSARRDHQPTSFLVIGGDPGVGKTRFMRAMIDTAKGMNMGVIICRPSLSQASTPYHTICSIVLQLLDLQDVRSPQEREHRLHERFEDSDLIWDLCLLNDLLGIQIPVTDEIADMSRQERIEALRALLAYIVSETRSLDSTGTLIAIDDAQYIDQDSWTYLEAFPSERCLIALGMTEFRRDADVPQAAARILQSSSAVHIKLQGLQPQCMEPLLCQLLEMDSVPRELSIMLTSHQRGRINPSWVKQCVFNMLHHGQLELISTGDKPECRVAKGVRLMELDIPPSLRGCIVAFIDRLPELQRTAVKIMSVVGTSFNADVMCHLMPNVAPHKIRLTIGAIQSAGILSFEVRGEHGGGALRFQSTTLQETAYALLLEKQRRKLHEKYAVYLENQHFCRCNGSSKAFGKLSIFGKQKDDNSNTISSTNGEQSLQAVYPQLVTHWRKANNMQKTIEYMIHGAESAIALGYNMQALSYIFQAKKLSPSPMQRVQLDELSLKATAGLFLMKKRQSMSPKGPKFKWRNMAAKARNFERTNSIAEEEESELQESEFTPPNQPRPTPDTENRIQDGWSQVNPLTPTREHSLTNNVNAMAKKPAKMTTYRISKYYLFAVLALCLALWLLRYLQRIQASTSENIT